MRSDASRFIVLACAALAVLTEAYSAETELASPDGLVSYLYTPKEKPDPNKTYWLVVGVHGVGGNGKGACGIAEWAGAFDDVLVLGPSFAQPKFEGNEARPKQLPGESYQRSGPAHEAKLSGLISKIERTWKLHPKIFLHGFSAGAQFVHRYAMKQPEQVAGVSAHSAGSWARREGDDRINPAAKPVPFALSCGEDDKGSGGPPGTPPRIDGVRQFASDLRALGFSVELQTWPSVGHQQTPEAKAMGRTLFERVRVGSHGN